MDLFEDLSGSELLAACEIYYDYFSGRPIKTPEQFYVKVFVKKLRNKYPSIVICHRSNSTLQTTMLDEDMKNYSYPMSVNVLEM
jgi:hypothetical protein